MSPNPSFPSDWSDDAEMDGDPFWDDAPLLPWPEEGSVLAREIESTLDSAPAEFLSFVSNTLLGCVGCAELFIDDVGAAAPRAMRAMATAAQWLLGSREITIMGSDLPRWLFELDDTKVTATSQRTESTGDLSVLVEFELTTDTRATAQIRIDHERDVIVDAFVVDDPIDEVELVLTAVDLGPAEPFEPVARRLAAHICVIGLGLHRIAICDDRRGHPWPANEPLITWIVRILARSQASVHAGDAAA